MRIQSTIPSQQQRNELKSRRVRLVALVAAVPTSGLFPVLAGLLRRATMAAVTATLLAAGSAVAQTPIDAQAIQQQRRAAEREEASRREQEDRPALRLVKPASVPAPLLPKSEAPCFVIHRIDISGDLGNSFTSLIDAVDGVAQTDSPLGRCLGVEGISVVAKRLQNAMLAAGFVTSRVLVGPQDLAGGTLILSLIPGRIHAIRFAPGSSRWAKLWTAFPVEAGDVLNLRDIEQALENFKRLPTADADIRIEATDTPGESDLVVSYTQTTPIRLSLSTDNAGTKATGRNQAAGTLAYDNLLTLNDLFYVTLSQNLEAPFSSSDHGTNASTFHYSIPFGYWSLSATRSRNRYYQTLAGQYENTLYSGLSRTSEVKLSRLMYRDAVRKTSVSARAFQRRSSNFADDLEVDVQRRVVGGWQAGIEHRESIGPGTMNVELNYRRGTGAFGALRAPEDDFGEGSARAGIYNADLSLTTPLWWPVAVLWAAADDAPASSSGLFETLRYSGRLRAQLNRTAVTPQDRFAVGGRYTVRGFDGERSLAGDRGWLIRNELIAPIVAGLDGYVGVDHARIGGPSAESAIGDALTGGVLGVRGNVKALQFDLFLGAPIHKPAGFVTAGLTGGFDLNYSF